MDKKDLNSQAEKYRLEMMKLYGKRCEDKKDVCESDPPEKEIFPQNNDINEEEYTPQNIQNPTAEEEKPSPLPDNDDLPEDTAFSPYDEKEEGYTSDDEDNFSTRYPEPDLSSLDTDFGTTENDSPPEYVSVESLGNKIGYIIVNVRTGDESSAVADATVLVTAIVDGNRMIIASGQTNHNGTTPIFEVPVPDLSLSQSPYPNTRPYNLFDVSVTAEGYFNARSVDVPVFEGITSVQNFNMIPVPSMMNEDDEILTYFNQEPNFPNKADEV